MLNPVEPVEKALDAPIVAAKAAVLHRPIAQLGQHPLQPANHLRGRVDRGQKCREPYAEAQPETRRYPGNQVQRELAQIVAEIELVAVEPEHAQKQKEKGKAQKNPCDPQSVVDATRDFLEGRCRRQAGPGESKQPAQGQERGQQDSEFDDDDHKSGGQAAIRLNACQPLQT